MSGASGAARAAAEDDTDACVARLEPVVELWRKAASANAIARFARAAELAERALAKAEELLSPDSLVVCYTLVVARHTVVSLFRPDSASVICLLLFAETDILNLRQDHQENELLP